MKKGVATVIYRERWKDGRKVYNLLNLTVNHKGDNISLWNAWTDENGEPCDMAADAFTGHKKPIKLYDYVGLNAIYKSVLQILKNNGFYTDRFQEFGRTFYNIQWIECGGWSVSKYGYEMEGRA